MLKYFIIASFLLVSTSAAAEDNIFNADMSNPDLSAAISSFEQVCMPFVLHETELTQKDDWQHTTKLMKNLEFASESIGTKSRRFQIKPMQLDPIGPRVSATGEIHMRAYTPRNFRTVTYRVETYKKETEPHLTATLDWNYPSQKAPGKSCAITLERTSITPAFFVDAVIYRDDSWTAMSSEGTSQKRWSQCVSDAGNDFEFVAEYREDTIFLSMTRSDFFEPKLCH